MLPYKTLIHIDRDVRTPVFLQITNEFIRSISAGVISSGLKLPGSRTLSGILSVHRQTIIAAYEELSAQGWVEIRPSQGCFVRATLPLIRPRSIHPTQSQQSRKKSHFTLLSKFAELDDAPALSKPSLALTIDDGYPDVRLAPLKALAKNVSFIVNSALGSSLMNYSQAYRGDLGLRKEIIKYLSETRGIYASMENIIITRGSLMAFYLLFQTILEAGDNVIVGDPGFNEGYNTIKLAGGNLVRVPVDEDGMDVDEVALICQQTPIRAVYIVPHHHYPTTVSLSASRRMKLLSLAETYKFAIIEDDYDYDFHYSSSPVLPIASSDYVGVVAYVGSFSKIIAPSLRIGFIIGASDLIDEVAVLSRYIDSFGNTAMERAVAMLFQQGEVRRHLKKAVRVYEERRDLFCRLLEEQIGEAIQFDTPEGGLAAWLRFNNDISLEKVITAAANKGLRIPGNSGFCQPGHPLNATRMGFASLRPKEIIKVVSTLRESIETVA